MQTMATIHDRNQRRALIRRALAVPAGGVAALAILAACGSSSDGGSSAQSGDSGGSSSGKAIVSAQNTSGAGPVLVDSSGKTLYFSDQEKNGSISCTGPCLGFWFPLTASDKSIPTPDGISGKLGTLKRSDDGKLQVTYNGAPLYTFKLDSSSGDMKGDNFSDDFGNTHFTWHAAGAQKAARSSSSPKSGGGDNGGYNNDGY